MTPGEWLALLYGNAERGWLTISFKRDAAARGTPDDPFGTEWFHVANHPLAADRARALAETHNVYFGLALRRERLPDGQRGCSEDTAALRCLWVELDAEGPQHAGGKRYFQSKGAALAFLAKLPHRPTVTVDSGGGIHAYWMFRELWEFEADEREYAAALVRGWQGYIRTAAREAGAEVDSTHDLARVLRVPGTYNRKAGEVLPVEVVEADGPQFNPGDFDLWQDYSETPLRSVRQDFEVRAGAQPPAMKYAALRENDKRFRDTLDGNRRDLKDQSPSAVCMALANIVAAAGWTDQEAVDLLVSYRAQVKARPKPAGWYALTLAKARNGSGIVPAAETAQTVVRIASTPEPDEKLAGLSKLLGFRVRRFVQHRPPDPSDYIQRSWYVLETDLGHVEIPNAETLISRQAMRALIVDRLRWQIQVAAKDWPAVIDALLAVCVLEEAPAEASEHQEIREALAAFCERRGTCENPLHAHETGALLLMDGRKWFSLNAFVEWCQVRMHLRTSARLVASKIQAIGCSRLKLQLQNPKGGNRTSVTVWSVPEP